MADEPTPSISILAQHVAAKRRAPIYGNAIAEVSAIALDVSAMMAYVVPLLNVIIQTPAIANSSDSAFLQSVFGQLKTRFEAHSIAMAELNRAR
jgi:hypothetical protein